MTSYVNDTSNPAGAQDPKSELNTTGIVPFEAAARCFRGADIHISAEGDGAMIVFHYIFPDGAQDVNIILPTRIALAVRYALGESEGGA